MKNNLKTLLKNTLAILFISLVTISCNNDDDDNNSVSPIPTADDFLMAKVNGVQYNATGFEVTASRKTNGGVQIFTTIATGTQIQMYVDNVAAVGTYPTTSVGSNPFAKMAVVTGSPAVLYESGECTTSGVLTITSISSTEMTGTFSFTTATIGGACPRPTKTITEGSFKTPL